MAGFQPSTNGRIWVFTEAVSSSSWVTASSFVMGGSRPARGGLSAVVSRRGGVFRSCSIPVVRLPRTRAVVGCRFSRFPSSAAWTNVRLDVRSGGGSSCASRAALVVLVPVVEVWPLDAVCAVCGAGRIVDEGLRRRSPASSRFWSSAAFVGCLVGAVLRPVAPSSLLGRTAVRFMSYRGSLLSASDGGAASGWCSRWSRRSVCHGNAMHRLVLFAAVEAVRRPGVRDRSDRCAGSRRCAAGRRLAGSASRCRAARRRADPGVGARALVVRIDCGESWRAACRVGSWRSTPGVRGVVRGGDSTPQSENWGRGTANNWGRGPPNNWGRGNGPIRYMSMSRVNVTTGSSLPAGKNTG